MRHDCILAALFMRCDLRSRNTIHEELSFLGYIHTHQLQLSSLFIHIVDNPAPHLTAHKTEQRQCFY